MKIQRVSVNPEYAEDCLKIRLRCGKRGIVPISQPAERRQRVIKQTVSAGAPTWPNMDLQSPSEPDENELKPSGRQLT